MFRLSGFQPWHAQKLAANGVTACTRHATDVKLCAIRTASTTCARVSTVSLCSFNCVYNCVEIVKRVFCEAEGDHRNALRPSVCPSVCLFVRNIFVFASYRPHSLKDFLQILAQMFSLLRRCEEDTSKPFWLKVR